MPIRRLGRALQPWLFVAPFLLAFTGLFLGPAGYAFWLSFTRYRGFGVARWVGLDNYRFVLGYDAFWGMLENTLFYWVAHAVPMMALALLLAVLVQRQAIGWARSFKTLVFLPQMLASVATALCSRTSSAPTTAWWTGARRRYALAYRPGTVALDCGVRADLARHRLLVHRLPGGTYHHPAGGR